MENVNIPPKGKSTGRKPIYKFNTLNVGEYITTTLENRSKAAGAATNYSKRHKIKLTVRKVENEIRIYREH